MHGSIISPRHGSKKSSLKGWLGYKHGTPLILLTRIQGTFGFKGSMVGCKIMFALRILQMKKNSWLLIFLQVGQIDKLISHIERLNLDQNTRVLFKVSVW